MSRQPVHIAGAGLVGPLMAVYLAKKGFEVELHERRGDMRRETVEAGRSINLAITARGWKALEEVGLKEKVRAISIPMKGRMIHDPSGKTELQPYGQKEHEVIYAASRGLLNIMLLDAAESYKNVRVHFGRRCTGYDLKSETLGFADAAGTPEQVKAGVVIGADGAWSAVRKSLVSQVDNVNYSQSFLSYGYKELVIPAAPGGGFRLEANALHIWPRKRFMMIALPNTEGSFTVTLFYPNEGPESFATLNTRAAAQSFFETNFADAVPLMPALLEDFFGNPTGALVTIKCGPWNAGGKALLIGDAAHAIVPFFAQGMNSGFEDCALLNSLIVSDNPDWSKVFADFTRLRKPSTDAIADMAVENFVEMRDKVTDPQFLLRKKVGFELEKRWPDRFVPRYSMVTFRPDISYAEAQRRGALQDGVLDRLCANISAPEQVDWDEAEKLLRALA